MDSGFGRLFRSKRSGRKGPSELRPHALEPGRSCLLKVSSRGAHIALFQGVKNGLYHFSVLRPDEGTNLLCWLDARYLVGDFHAYPAFDEYANPYVEFWYELGDYQPTQWFKMFEEAYRKEQDATAKPEQQQPQQQQPQDNTIQLPYLTRTTDTPPSIKEESHAELFLDLFNSEERSCSRDSFYQPSSHRPRSRRPSIRQYLMKRVAPTPPPHE